MSTTRFLQTLGEACRKTDWQIHAYCLMGNHFHVVPETPGANLVAGMRWFTWTHVANRLSHKSAQPDKQPDLDLCQK
jgi:putative transposase